MDYYYLYKKYTIYKDDYNVNEISNYCNLLIEIDELVKINERLKTAYRTLESEYRKLGIKFYTLEDEKEATKCLEDKNRALELKLERFRKIILEFQKEKTEIEKFNDEIIEVSVAQHENGEPFTPFTFQTEKLVGPNRVNPIRVEGNVCLRFEYKVTVSREVVDSHNK